MAQETLLDMLSIPGRWVEGVYDRIRGGEERTPEPMGPDASRWGRASQHDRIHDREVIEPSNLDAEWFRRESRKRHSEELAHLTSLPMLAPIHVQLETDVWVLLPSFSDGKYLGSMENVKANYLKSGEHLGKYTTKERAFKAGVDLENARKEGIYTGPPRPR